MKVDYTITDDDYLRFNLYYLEHSPSQRRLQFFFRFVVPVFLAAIFLISTGYPRIWWVWAIALGIYVVWAMLWPMFHKVIVKRLIARMFKRGNEFTGKFSLELADGCIRESGNGRTSEIRYDQVRQIVQDGDLCYIYVGALSACILPENAFADEEQRKLFFDTLESKMKT